MALRIAARVKGGTRAITVQKNIAFNVDWAYNVHLWDTAAVGRNGPGSSVALVAQHQMSAAIADAPARRISGGSVHECAATSSS